MSYPLFDILLLMKDSKSLINFKVRDNLINFLLNNDEKG
jgi:hypothetical protein